MGTIFGKGIYEKDSAFASSLPASKRAFEK
jgi:hypothetical protein